MSESLRQLIRSAAAGDARAFGALHARYARMVHAILLARLPPHEADDLLQEVFLQAWRKLAQLDDAAHFGGWLAAIARHRAADFFRARHVTEPLEEAWPDARGATSSDVAEARNVIAAVQRLPEAYRETLLMRLCEGMNGPEIAEITGLEPGSVRINLHRGMKLLREALGIEVKAVMSGGPHE